MLMPVEPYLGGPRAITNHKRGDAYSSVTFTNCQQGLHKLAGKTICHLIAITHFAQHPATRTSKPSDHKGLRARQRAISSAVCANPHTRPPTGQHFRITDIGGGDKVKRIETINVGHVPPESQPTLRQGSKLTCNAAPLSQSPHIFSRSVTWRAAS